MQADICVCVSTEFQFCKNVAFLLGDFFCQSSHLHTEAYVLDMRSIAFRSGCFSWQNFNWRERRQNWICQALKNYDNRNTFLTGRIFCQSSRLQTAAYVLDMKSIAFRSGCFSWQNFSRRERRQNWICQALKNYDNRNTFLTGDFFCQGSHLQTAAYVLDMKSIAFRSGCFSWQNFNRREQRLDWICQALKNYDNRNTFLTGRIFCQSSRLQTAAYVLDMKSIAFRSGCFSWQNFSRRERRLDWICQALKI